MNDTTIASFASALDADQPSGENLEYDAQYLALETALEGTPEVEYGGTVTPATPPDWQAVQALALALMARTRDLRVALALTRSALALQGAAGLADGLALLDWMLDQQWDTVHPQLEAEDDFDPMLRINVLAGLVAPAQLLRELRTTPLVRVKALGSFSLRDIEQARDGVRVSEDSDEDGSEQPTRTNPNLIGAAFSAADPGELAATATALQTARDAAQAIEAHLAQHVGVGKQLDLAPLSTLIDQALTAMRDYAPAPAAGQDAEAADAAAPDGQVAMRQTASDVVSSRADVVRLLDRICDYYDQQEPASPIPLLLQRARRLVDKRFAELVQDLAPDGLSQLSRASGVQHEN